MTDDRVLEYLRSRGQAAPPVGLVTSVMTAVEAAPEPRSRFAALLPAAVATGAVAIIALVGLLFGPGRDVGPPPTPTASEAAATVVELEGAVAEATERLAEADAVEGRHVFTIGDYLASATWFDWRRSGAHVVVTRHDVDVRQPWWTDPEGEPLTVGERIEETIDVVVDGAWYRTEGGRWIVEERDGVAPPLTWGIGMLTGAIPPAPGTDGAEGVVVTRGPAADGGVVWTMELSTDEGETSSEWHIGADGVLVSFSTRADGVALDPTTGIGDVANAGEIVFEPVADPAPIREPDLDATPDPADFAYPPDMPLQPRSASLDGVEQVEACEHPSGVYRVTLPEGWWTNRDGGPDGLWQGCELFGPDPFPVTPTADRTWPDGVALTIGWVDGGCRGFIWDLLSSEPTTVDGLPASVNEYTLPGDGEPGYAYEYNIDLSDPGVDCEVGGRWIGASTNREMTGDYDANKAFLDGIMGTMEVTPP